MLFNRVKIQTESNNYSFESVNGFHFRWGMEVPYRPNLQIIALSLSGILYSAIIIQTKTRKSLSESD